MADKYLNQTGLSYYHNRIKTVFADKSEIPTKTSDLTNDGDGQSNFATESYVDTYGGKIDEIQVNSVPQTITNKTVNIDLSAYALAADVPTATSDLTNDSDFQTGTEVQATIDNALADITSFDFEVVQSLPQTGEKGVIYLVANSGSGQNVYDEYIWIDGNPGSYEKIGSTDVDLSNYWTSASGQSNSLIAITTAEIDTLFS